MQNALCSQRARVRWLFTKTTLRVMQLTAVFLLAATITVSATTRSQTVTYAGKNVPLKTVFTAVEQQTGFLFAYNDDLISRAKPVTISVNNEPLEQFMQRLLTGQPLDFSIEVNTIFIKRKIVVKPTVNDQLGVEVAPPVKGRITNADGQPLEGASVRIKGTKKGVSTNAFGQFTIEAKEGEVLLISYTGFKEREITVAANNTNLNIALAVSDNPLDDIQIIAYGKSSQRLSTSNISSVKAKDIEKAPIANPLLALQGRVPGLLITQNTGVPGASVTARIQGQNSMLSGNEPFYVIDGVPYTASLPVNLNAGVLGSSGSSFYGGTGYGSPLNYLNPADIESIDVLKDADATAIYGSRAANGAILITTKKGKGGRMGGDFNVQTGWGEVPRKLKMLNTSQYLTMRREALRNANAEILSTDVDLGGAWDTTRYTNWQQELLGGHAQYIDGQLTLSGGDANARYLIGAGYHRETTVTPGDFSDQKASMHVSLNLASPNQKCKVQFSGEYMVDNNRLPTSNNITLSAIEMVPFAPALYNKDGSINWDLDSLGNTNWPGRTNPIADLNNRYKNKTSNLLANTIVSYSFIQGLDARISMGYTNLLTDEIQAFPLSARAPNVRPTATRVGFFGASNINSWIVEPQLSYNKIIRNSHLDVLIGGTMQQNNTKGQMLLARGYSSDITIEDIRAASNLFVTNSLASTYKYTALFTRVKWDYDGRYIVNLTARRDGSSSFGPANRFKNFSAIGAAWIFTNEKWSSFPAFISYGKLKASYGITGNDQIGNYTFLDLYTPTGSSIPYQGIVALTTNSLFNPDLQWERTRKINLGIDLGFLKDRILLAANYALNRSDNQLNSYVLPYTSGFESIVRNFPGVVENRNIEVSINTVNVKTKEIKWNTSFNITIPQNKLIKFDGLQKAAINTGGFIIGQPLNVVKAYKFLGMDPQTGMYTVADANGNPTTTPTAADQTELININPSIYGGLENSFEYKGLKLSFLFQFIQQKTMGYWTSQPYPGTFGNQPVQVLDRWQKPGDIATYQPFRSSPPTNILGFTDANYVDGSYIRLKNVSLSWELPNVLVQKWRFQKIRLYAHAQNLLTFTKYRGLDPETGYFASLPPLRVITVGVQLSF